MTSPWLVPEQLLTVVIANDVQVEAFGVKVFGDDGGDLNLRPLSLGMSP